MSKEEFLDLADKVSEGRANLEELARFNSYFNQYQEAFNEWGKIKEAEKQFIKQFIHKRIYAQIHNKPLPSVRRLVWPLYVAAALILCVFSFGLYFYQQKKLPVESIAKQDSDLLPGGNRATLTLANGRKVDLSEVKNAEIVNNTSFSIRTTSNGQLLYKIAANAIVDTSIHRIETPVGGQFQVTLPDGTLVWLNSSSSLSYPVTFFGNRRNVTVTGEAYFEVAPNKKMPFVVRSSKQVIEVLGTHFNLKAYSDEAAEETTLFEGSVKVGTSKNNLVLKPRQQATILNEKAVLKTDADIESALAWKKGKFQFSNMNIEDIMKNLSRWYDFTYQYRGKITSSTFEGRFSRTNNLSAILSSLEKTGEIHFKIEGRRVTVMP